MSRQFIRFCLLGLGFSLAWPRALWFFTSESFSNALFSPFVTPLLLPTDILALVFVGFVLVSRHDEIYFWKNVGFRFLLVIFMILSFYSLFLGIGVAQVVWLMRFLLIGVTFFILRDVLIRDVVCEKKWGWFCEKIRVVKNKMVVLPWLAGFWARRKFEIDGFVDFWKIGLFVGLFLNVFLAFWQVLVGSSFGLPGEPWLDVGAPGPAKIAVFGFTFLRGVGFFPHANVLAVFGLLAVLIFSHKKCDLQKFGEVLGIFAVFLSFSRAGILGLFIFYGFQLWRNVEWRKDVFSRWGNGFFAGFFTIIFGVIFLTRGGLGEMRAGDFGRAVGAIIENPWGFGLLNSTFVGAGDLPWMLAPPHSVLLAFFVDFGVFIGFLVLGFLIWFFWHRKIWDWRFLVFLPSFLFDHLFYSLPVGMWLAGMVVFVVLGRKFDE